VKVGAVRVSPLVQCIRNELRTVVDRDGARKSVLRSDLREKPNHRWSSDTSFHHDTRSSARERVDERQDAKAMAIALPTFRHTTSTGTPLSTSRMARSITSMGNFCPRGMSVLLGIQQRTSPLVYFSGGTSAKVSGMFVVEHEMNRYPCPCLLR